MLLLLTRSRGGGVEEFHVNQKRGPKYPTAETRKEPMEELLYPLRVPELSRAILTRSSLLYLDGRATEGPCRLPASACHFPSVHLY